MGFIDNVMARFRQKTDEKNRRVQRNTDEALRDISALGLGGGRVRSREEVDFEKRGVAGKLPKHLPMGSVLMQCRRGFYIKQFGCAPLSGPCPTRAGAEKTALRNLGQ